MDSQTFNLKWFNGADGVTIQPGAPAIPKQVMDVTAANMILRGVGFCERRLHRHQQCPAAHRSARDRGDDAEQHLRLADTFFPQRLATANYFGALGDSGRTTLVVNPAQHRTFGTRRPDVPVNTVRNYANLDMKLFYSPKTFKCLSASRTRGAAPPGISEVTGTPANGVVTFSARVTGDPVAGCSRRG